MADQPQYKVESEEHPGGYDYMIIETATGRICENYHSDYDMAVAMTTWGNEHPNYFDPLPADLEPIWSLEQRGNTIFMSARYPNGNQNQAD